jgi:Xaa-Pro aminopeptidase
MTTGADPRPAARPIPAARYAERLAAGRELIARHGFAAILLGVGPDLRYLTGFVGDPMERLTLLAIPPKGPVWFVVPRLEATKAEATPLVRAGAAEVVAFEETEDAAVRLANLLSGARLEAGEAAWEPIGISDRLWAMHVLELQRTMPGRRFDSASKVMRELRQIKDADETRLLGLAAAAADRTVDAIAAGPLVGRTEAEVSREIRARLVDEGHDLGDFAIVGSGPNSASPHHDASERKIKAGEPVVLDIGGSLSGYMSDTTRTIWVAGAGGTQPDLEFRRVYDLVQVANEQATAAVRPGIAAEQVDATARKVIAGAGYGEFFTHRTGHGIGLEVHEDPYIVSGNSAPLEPGMAFSVEPGVYLPGRWGVRLENIVVCGEAAGASLNLSSLDLRIVHG